MPHPLDHHKGKKAIMSMYNATDKSVVVWFAPGSSEISASARERNAEAIGMASAAMETTSEDFLRQSRVLHGFIDPRDGGGCGQEAASLRMGTIPLGVVTSREMMGPSGGCASLTTSRESLEVKCPSFVYSLLACDLSRSWRDRMFIWK